ncbi:MAG: TetR/AcrR family transcriptional regulator [Lachnospiraceae bacterium]|nr:TetR/AcrR family transcriptional regulator [Lachnospiraceae bacterium]
MSKILENPRGALIAEARRQVNEIGYSKMTIRSVAAKCGIGTGTVYNYFKSKEMLVASFMSEDWHATVAKIEKEISGVQKPMEACEVVFNAVLEFSSKNETLFKDKEAVKIYSSASGKGHERLVLQLSHYIGPYCEKYARSYTPELPDFISEAIISRVLAGKDFAGLKNIICQLFKEDC